MPGKSSWRRMVCHWDPLSGKLVRGGVRMWEKKPPGWLQQSPLKTSPATFPSNQPAGLRSALCGRLDQAARVGCESGARHLGMLAMGCGDAGGLKCRGESMEGQRWVRLTSRPQRSNMSHLSWPLGQVFWVSSHCGYQSLTVDSLILHHKYLITCVGTWRTCGHWIGSVINDKGCRVQAVAVKVKVSMHELAVVGIHDREFNWQTVCQVGKNGDLPELAVDYNIYLLTWGKGRGKALPKQSLPFLKMWKPKFNECAGL